MHKNILLFNNNIMKKEEKETLLNFIEKSTSPYSVVKNVVDILNNNGFSPLNEDKFESIEYGKFYIERNNSSLIIVDIPRKPSNSNVVCITSHIDTPSFKIKEDSLYNSSGYLLLNIMPHGGLLDYSWFDRPLGISGLITSLDQNKAIKKTIVELDHPIGIIPSVSIHQNPKANTSLTINEQDDMQLLVDLEDKNVNTYEYLNSLFNEDIISFDLFLYNYEKPYLIGKNKDILISPRIDNITSLYASLYGFLETNENNIKILALFNNEEIGNTNIDGASSNFLSKVINTIKNKYSKNNELILVNFDNMHAKHPLNKSVNDVSGCSSISNGIVLSNEKQCITTPISSSIIKLICKNNNIKYTSSSCRNDLCGGLSLACENLKNINAISADIGIVQLAMHSSYETCFVNDVYELKRLATALYNADVINKDGKYYIN